MMTYRENLRPQVKQYYFQLRKFTQCSADIYTEMSKQQKKFLYIFKPKFPTIIVRAPSPIKKIHGWSIDTIEVLQKLNDNDRVFHWKKIVIDFKGELILTVLNEFNRQLKNEINEVIPRKTLELASWLSTDIDDILMVNEKTQVTCGFEHGYVFIETLLRLRYSDYFQIHGWVSNQWEGLLQIANSQKIEKNRSWGTLLEDIYQFICHYEIVKDSKFTDMFEMTKKDKKVVIQRAKDNFEKLQEKRVMEKYRLYEYIDK